MTERTEPRTIEEVAEAVDREVHMPGLRCPYCACANDGTSEVKGKSRPSPGAYSVCFYCVKVALFTEDPANECGLGLRRLTNEEQRFIDHDPEAMIIRWTVSEVRGMHARHPAIRERMAEYFPDGVLPELPDDGAAGEGA